MITRFPAIAAACLAAVLAAPIVACQKVPLLAPSGSTIVLSASVNALPVNGSTTISAQVIEASGFPPHSGTHVTFTTSLGAMQPADASTDVNGRAVATFLAGSNNGTANITAISGGASVGTNGALKILVGTAAAGGIRLAANPTLVPATGGSSTITATVLDINGNLLVGAPVSFTTTAGALSATIATTDANGNAQVTLQTTTKATVTATVGAQGTTQTPSTGGTTPTTPTPTTSGPTTAQVVVDVAGAPTIVITPPTTPPSAGLPGSFTFVVTAATTNGSAVRDVTVNWGDGSIQDLGAVTGTAIVSHVFTRAGSYTISATLTDAAGNSVTVSTGVVVIPVPRPTIIIQFSDGTFAHPANVTFNIQITAPTGVGIQDVTIDFGDGTVTDVGGATGSLPPISHTYQNGPQSYTVRVIVSDTTGNTTTGTTVVNIT